MVDHCCPYCHYTASEQDEFVVQTVWKRQKKVQFFHLACYKQHTRGVKNGKLQE